MPMIWKYAKKRFPIIVLQNTVFQNTVFQKWFSENGFPKHGFPKNSFPKINFQKRSEVKCGSNGSHNSINRNGSHDSVNRKGMSLFCQPKHMSWSRQPSQPAPPDWTFGYLDMWIIVTNLLLHPQSGLLCGAALPGVFFPEKTRPWCFCSLKQCFLHSTKTIFNWTRLDRRGLKS